jgi:hypothetical protein
VHDPAFHLGGANTPLALIEIDLVPLGPAKFAWSHENL